MLPKRNSIVKVNGNRLVLIAGINLPNLKWFVRCLARLENNVEQLSQLFPPSVTFSNKDIRHLIRDL